METKTTNSALLVMDVQSAIIGALPEKEKFVENVRKAISIARSKKIPVIYVVVGFRQGTPEINMKNKGFASNKERFANVNMNDFLKIAPEVSPQEDELTVIKRRVSAFTGSDLEVILRAYNVEHMILTGCATSGVVLSTTREAADKDYQITILSDACADGDPEIHKILTSKVFPRQADVLSVEEWNNHVN